MNDSIRRKIGAGCFILGGAVYLLAEKISALAWHVPAYRYMQNYISDLGIPVCGVLADGRAICSPRHVVMNMGFAAEGILFFLACFLIGSGCRPRGRWLFLLTGLLHGIGGVMIALFHSGGGNGGITLHQAGAVLAIAGGNLCLLTAGMLLRGHSRRRDRQWGGISLLLGTVGLLSMLIIPLNLLPTGLIERASVYPITCWQILTGLWLLRAKA